MTTELPSLGMAFYDRRGRPMDGWEGLSLAFGFIPGYKRVREAYVRDYRVSTVWLGFDQGFVPFNRQPLIFETMVFGPNDHRERLLYSTEEEAVEGHFAILHRLLALRRIPASEVRGWLELTGWNRRKALCRRG